MKHFLLRVFCAALGIVAATSAFADTNRFNVLLIISDDLRTELSCYGSRIAKTPNLDQLAASGVRFDRAYCQVPLCNPTRASMLTGLRPTHTGVLGNRTDFRTAHPEIVTLPQLFKENGYASLRTGKIFHGGIDDLKSWTEGGDPRRIIPEQQIAGQLKYETEADDPAAAGLTRTQRSDRWIVLKGNGEAHGDYRVADEAIDFLRRFKDKPFFLGCGFSKPHSPPAAPQKFYDLYSVDQIPLPPDFAPRPTVPAGFPKAAIRPKNADLFVGRDASPEQAREMIRAYAASTSWMDWNVGRVMAELDRLGLREQTIVVFWGDHGYQLGEKGKWSKAGSLFEQGTRVPLMIAAPTAKGNGRVSPRIVESLDIFPTLAELCGLPVPKTVEGRSLVPLLQNPEAEWNHPAFSVWSENGKTLHGAAVRTDRWRYAEFTGGGGGAMLFDETADPNELRNLADDPKLAAVRSELSKLIQDCVADSAK